MIRPADLINSLGERLRMSSQHFNVLRTGVSFFQCPDTPVKCCQIRLKLIYACEMIFGLRECPSPPGTHIFFPQGKYGHTFVSGICGGKTKLAGRNKGCL